MFLTALLLLVPIGAAAVREDESVRQHVDVEPLEPGDPWGTAVHTIDSGEAGPTVLVVAGVHENESAGALAAEQLAGWSPTRGRLIVVARANALALDFEESAANSERDVDRAFPRRPGESPRGELSNALWDLVNELEPDYLIELHEGRDFARVNPRGVGSTIVTDATPGSLARAGAMAATLNATIMDERLHFVVKESAVSGSLARAAHDLLGVPSLVLETTTKGQAEAFRARQHRILVATFLTGIGMLEHGPDVLVGTSAAEHHVKVALYVSAGVSGSGPDRIEEILESTGDFVVRRVCASDVRAGVLDQFDVVVFPGGSATSQANSIGAAGREAVRQFVANGGGYFGICAGAYLASSEYDWALGLLAANIVDRENWARGVGEVLLELTPLGMALLQSRSRPAGVHYANGPIFAPGGDDEDAGFHVLARFGGEVERPGVPLGVMPDAPAIVLSRFGSGRVVCSSPHPEQTHGLESLVVELVRVASAR